MPKIKVKDININPQYAELVPSLTKETFESLLSSIKEDGLHEPITINAAGIILDGHHRFEACCRLGIKTGFKFKQFDNELQEKMYVINANLERRQLNAAQRVQLVLRKKPILQKLAKIHTSKGVRVCRSTGMQK